MPFKTPLQAAIAHLISKGVVKGNADVARDLKMKSRSTVTSYANGNIPISYKFQTMFENKYGIKLSDFGGSESAKTVSEESGVFDLMLRQSAQLQGMNQKLNEIIQQQIVSAAISAEYQRWLVSKLDSGSNADDSVVAQQRRAFDRLTHNQQADMS